MKWRVEGADRESGEDFALEVEAESEDQARRRASRRGMLVARAQPLSAAISAPPPPQMSYATPRAKEPIRGVSGFGVAALVLGVVACLVAWIPIIGILTLPIVLIGSILAVIGIIVSLAGRRSGVGMPVAGLLTCTIAGVMALVITGSSLAAIDDALQSTAQPKQAVLPSGDGGRGASDAISTAGPEPAAPSRASESEERQKSPEPDPVFAGLGEQAILGDIGVEIVSVRVQRVAVMGLMDKEQRSADPLLQIHLRVHNRSESRKHDYQTWRGESISFERDFATLTDDVGNSYKRINFGFGTKLKGAVESRESLYPARTLDDQLVFEIPIDAAKYLELELPANNLGGEGMFRFRIPVSEIDGSA